VARRRAVTVSLAVLAWIAAPVWALGAQPADGSEAWAPAPVHAAAANNAAANEAQPANNAQPANTAQATKGAPATKAAPAKKGPVQAPSKPPLGTGGTVLAPEDEGSSAVSESGGDPLVDNGLGSPLCREGAEAELSSTGARACRISHFDAAQAPTGNYGFDVHINRGVTDVANDVDAEVLNGVQWSWTLLVAVVHGVIVMLEWCYSLDLLNSSKINGITQRLRETQATFTRPWLELALAVASMLALYHGIVRRQISQTLGETALMAVMMLGGLWVIVNPLGTIGALDAWANEASLGTLAAVTSGTPERSGRTLEQNMQSIFSGAIGGPWCYMEFGNVRWCESAHMDARLAAAGRRIATKERAKVGDQSAELLSAARTNGELFLALPANGARRNSINDSGSLFNVLCGGSQEPCHGPTAGEAEFRTGGGTLWRIAGLILFWIGVLGMVLMLGFIGIRLLTAALFSLFFLLLAPAAVIAPALGDGGRGAFRKWVTRLLGAVCSKLIYSFLLGVVLLMQRTLMSAASFGWAAQWALVSTMWWWLFVKRHEIDGLVHGEHRGVGHQREHRSLLRRARERAQNPPEMVRAGKWAKGKLRTPSPSVGQRKKLAQAGLARARGLADGQVRRTLEREHGAAHSLVQAAPEAEARISAKRAQLERTQAAHSAALRRAGEAKSAREAALNPHGLVALSDPGRTAARFAVEEKSQRRHAARLQDRMGRLRADIAGEQGSLTAARRTVADGEQAKRGTGSVYTREQAARRARDLDFQAALPDRGRAGPGGEKRDYAGAAGIAGYTRGELEALDPRGQRAARLEIDRELAARKGANVAAREVAASGEGSLKGREQKKADRLFDGSLEQEVKAEGHELPRTLKPRPKRPSFETNLQEWREEGRSNGASSGRRTAGESSVMRDAREVAAGRKRQLGREQRR
jgi:hypothetical protein